jgi:hypothetical protein
MWEEEREWGFFGVSVDGTTKVLVALFLLIGFA